MKVCLVLPTYNERENIDLLLFALEKVFKKMKTHEMHVLVVDDNSPDGTGDHVKVFMKDHKFVSMLSGKKEGLGRAYLRGFKEVLSNMDMDAVIMMDADFSHNPKRIPDMVKALEEGKDFVIGSRYVRGGKIPDWKIHRRVISIGGNLFARLVGGLYHVKDCTSGFRAIKTDLLKKIDFSTLHTKGYAFMSTLLFEATMVGASFEEIPITFNDRTRGKAKLNKKDVIEFFFNSFRLRFRSSERFIKFGVVGGSGILVNLGFLYFFVEVLNLGKNFLAPILAVELSIIWNFFLNDRWTFKDRKKQKSLLSKMFKFHVAALSGLVINILIYNFFLGLGFISSLGGKYDYLLAQFIAICLVFTWNYLINLKWTWRE